MRFVCGHIPPCSFCHLLNAPEERQGEMWKSLWPGNPRSLCRHLGMVRLMSWVELVERAWKKTFAWFLAWFLVILGFSDTFFRWLEIPRGSFYSSTKQCLWSTLCCSLRVVISWHRLLDLTLKAWMFDIFSIYSPLKTDTAMAHILQIIGFSRSFPGFFHLICWDCLVEVVLAPIHPVLKERKSAHRFFRNCPGESSGWYHVLPYQKDAGTTWMNSIHIFWHSTRHIWW